MRRFNKLTGNIILVFHIFKEKISLLSTEKHEQYMAQNPLRSVSFNEEEAAEEDIGLRELK